VSNVIEGMETVVQSKKYEEDLVQMQSELMKSQLTIVADSAIVKAIIVTKKSKRYLSEPLKAIIDNKIMS